ncbi:DUF1810 domain-containing protein [Hydrogenophaga atypica]|uniref:DUF1810 domain-containing protein n=1 Tax=Hydrogenophaga atypica TaxID=249409 RepID=A0ABW2QJ50_9BURK
MAETVPIGSESQQAPDLGRFLEAQAPVLEDVMLELRQGHKATHWMWFVFPQLAALGRSQMARYYGLANLEEAQAYLSHPVLGERLKACCQLVLAHRGKAAEAMLGSVDAIKLRSCSTLFLQCAGLDSVFGKVLDGFFAGEPDPMTLAVLAQQAQARQQQV